MFKIIDLEVKNIIDKYRFVNELKNYSNKYYRNEKNIFLSIQSNEHVAMAEQSVINLLKAYSDIILLPSDIGELERALGVYEIAVRKVFQCYNNTDLDFYYTANQLQTLINKVQFYDSEIMALYKIMFIQTYFNISL